MRLPPLPLPTRSLLAGVLVTSCVVTAALGWSGLRLLTQQQELDERALRQDVDVAADRFAAAIHERLAEEGDRLEGWIAVRAGETDGAGTGWVAHVEHVAAVRTAQSVGLPFRPVAPHRPVTPAAFEAIEYMEFALRQPAVAAREYRRLTLLPDPHVRAGALFRLARVLRAQREFPSAVDAAKALADMGTVDVEGVAASLAGLDALRLASIGVGDAAAAGRVAEAMRARLDRGEWALDRTTAEFYRGMVSDSAAPPAWHLAAALADTWNRQGSPRQPTRGSTVVATPGGPALVCWRTNHSASAMSAAFLARVLEPMAPRTMRWSLSDADDQPVAANTGAGMVTMTSTRAVGGGSGWSIRVWPDVALATRVTSRSPLLAALAGTLLFVWGATALILRALAREARVARLQSDFVAAVSHEFRSPLTTMRQMAEMLDSERVPDEGRRKRYYQVLASEASRLQHLVETLLDFGRIDAGRTPTRRQAVDLAGLVASVVAEVRQQPRGAAATIELVPPGDGVRVHGDPDALRLALRNLVENAVKYSPGAPVIAIRWGIEGDRVAIAVSDRGLGIDPHEHVSIFGKFVRGQSAVDAHVGGTGVGLAVVQQVVAAHRGEIQLESQLGHGSIFTLRLPLAATEH